MNKLQLIVAWVMVAILLSGCATTINKTMQSWVGHHSNELIASWGPPQQVMDDGSGGKIFIYTQMRQWTTPGQSQTYTTSSVGVSGNYRHRTTTSQGTYDPPQTYEYVTHRMFWIDENGYIYRWAWKNL